MRCAAKAGILNRLPAKSLPFHLIRPYRGAERYSKSVRNAHTFIPHSSLPAPLTRAFRLLDILCPVGYNLPKGGEAMKDIPIFTSTEGIASLILREIPQRREAYVLIRGIFSDIDRMMSECERFCRAAGAERVYFSGEGDFSAYPVHARLIWRSIRRAALPASGATLVPVTMETAGDWLAHYQARFAAVPLARSCVDTADAWFIRDGGRTIGIGQLCGDELRTVAALAPGRGADCVAALASLSSAERLRLLCAMENAPAMALYDRLGFDRGEMKEIWYLRNR